MARKPSPSKTKAKARLASRPASRKVKGTAKTKSGHSQAHAKRTAAKHKAQKAAARFAWLKKPLKKLQSQTFTVPKLNLELPVAPTLAFTAMLGIAVGAGYWGAQSTFGGNGASTPSSKRVIQQTHSLEGVILPEPNGVAPHEARAYEEKAIEDVYEPTLEPVVQPQVAPDVEVARAPPPTSEEPVGQMPLWLKNAIAFNAPANTPMIAIVIDDMGVDRKRSKRMWNEVPAPLTLSFMTYADDLVPQSKAASAMGHELMLHMSMEPSNAAIDAGPNVLMTTMPDGEIRSLANWGMDRFEGFVGVNNHMGSRFTEDERSMRIVLEEIDKRGLLFLDSRTSSHTVGPRVARRLGLPALVRNVFLDNDNVPAKVLKQLDEVERLARKHGQAIAIGHPRDATIEVLKDWIGQARDRGLAIVPVTTLMQHKLNEIRAVQAKG